MIEVTVYRHNNDYKKVSSFGHAGYMDFGNDIVCSAVSVLIINTANSLEKFTEDFEKSYITPEGKTEIILKDNAGEKGTLLIDSMCLGLEGIQDKYGKKYLKIVYKEV